MTLLIRLLLFLLPFVLFFLWLKLCKNKTESGEVLDVGMQRRLIGSAVFVFLVFVAAVIVTVMETGKGRDLTYIPPREVNGEIVPGYFVDDEGNRVDRKDEDTP